MGFSLLFKRFFIPEWYVSSLGFKNYVHINKTRIPGFFKKKLNFKVNFSDRLKIIDDGNWKTNLLIQNA